MTPRADLIARLDYWEGVLRSAECGPLDVTGLSLADADLFIAGRAMMEPALAAAREMLEEHRAWNDGDFCWGCNWHTDDFKSEALLADCPVIQKWRGIVPRPPK